MSHIFPNTIHTDGSLKRAVPSIFMSKTTQTACVICSPFKLILSFYFKEVFHFLHKYGFYFEDLENIFWGSFKISEYGFRMNYFTTLFSKLIT
jgi:hypothetical protein